jgi:hypothetical protein
MAGYFEHSLELSALINEWDFLDRLNHLLFYFLSEKNAQNNTVHLKAVESRVVIVCYPACFAFRQPEIGDFVRMTENCHLFHSRVNLVFGQ